MSYALAAVKTLSSVHVAGKFIVRDGAGDAPEEEEWLKPKPRSNSLKPATAVVAVAAAGKKERRGTVFGAWFGQKSDKTSESSNTDSSLLRSSSLSLVGFGDAASRLLTKQQQQLLLNMGLSLRTGIAIIKVKESLVDRPPFAPTNPSTVQ